MAPGDQRPTHGRQEQVGHDAAGGPEDVVAGVAAAAQPQQGNAVTQGRDHPGEEQDGQQADAHRGEAESAAGRLRARGCPGGCPAGAPRAVRGRRLLAEEPEGEPAAPAEQQRAEGEMQQHADHPADEGRLDAELPADHRGVCRHLHQQLHHSQQREQQRVEAGKAEQQHTEVAALHEFDPPGTAAVLWYHSPPVPGRREPNAC